MAQVNTPQHDFKVFFRRLVVPGELGRDINKILSPSQSAGIYPMGNDPTKTLAVNQALAAAAKNPSPKTYSDLVNLLFKDYSPPQFKAAVVAKALAVSDGGASTRDAKLLASESQLAQVTKAIDDANAEIRGLYGFVGPLRTLPPTLTQNLTSQQAYYAFTADDPLAFAAGQPLSSIGYSYPFPPTVRTTDVTGTPMVPSVITPGVTTATTRSPLLRDRLTFATTITFLNQAKATNILGLADVDVVNRVLADLNTLLNSTPSATAETALRNDISTGLATILQLGTSATSTAKIVKLRDLVQTMTQQKQSLEASIKVLKDTLPIKPFYEPFLLSCLIGPYQVQTSMNRMGQPGTATVSFHLPLGSQGTVPDLFMGLPVADIYSLSLLEKKVKSTIPISSQTMNILQPNMRETTILPMDMIQVWGRRKFSTGSTFPGDYEVIFTGFITKPTVTYGGSAIGVTVQAEDVGKVLRLARVNLDPNIDPSFNPKGISPTVYQNKLQGTGQSGAELIRNLIVGKPDSFLGMSQVDVMQTVVQEPQGSTTVTTFTNTNKVVSVAADFQNMKLNLWEDLLNRWAPYAAQFKNTFPLWETDAKSKWDICREIADVTEFEFYADNLGVYNYHPPLYFLNPFAGQYLIDDVDIESESHSVDEAEVLTSVQVHSQPSFVADTDNFNPAKVNDAFVTSPDQVIQRFGVRFQSKSIPILSGTEWIIPNKANDPALDSANRDITRMGYARAWMNRRNARVRSATVTINGTPELRLCNTVAFVGNLKQTLKNVASAQMLATATGQTGVAGSTQYSLDSLSPGAASQLAQILVYYISAISHNYVQGGKYTTTLTLTHGRHWTDSLPAGNVGYALTDKDTNGAVAGLRAYYGQNGVDADAFAREVNNRIQFSITGDPKYLTPQSNSIFGFSARPVKPTLTEKFRSRLNSEIAGAVSASIRAYCTILSPHNDPDHPMRRAKNRSKSFGSLMGKVWNNATKPFRDFWKDIIDLFKNKTKSKLGKKAAEKAQQSLINLLKAQLAKVDKLINDAMQSLMKAVMGGKNPRIFKKFQTSDAIPVPFKELISSFGIDMTPFTNYPFGLIAFVYIAFGETDDQDEVTDKIAAPALLKEAAKDLDVQDNAKMKFVFNLPVLPVPITMPPPSNLAGSASSTSANVLTSIGLPPTIPPPDPVPPVVQNKKNLYVVGVAMIVESPKC